MPRRVKDVKETMAQEPAKSITLGKISII